MLRQMVLSAVRCRVVSATTTQRASLSSAAQQEAPNDTSIYEYRTYSIKPESYPSFLARMSIGSDRIATHLDDDEAVKVFVFTT